MSVMKRFFFCLVAALALAFSANAQQAQTAGWPTGMMTYNSWSGKVSVGGITMEKNMLPHYFTEEEMRLFNTSQGLYLGAIILAIPTGVSLGLGLGMLLPSWISGDVNAPIRKAGTTLLIAGGVALAATLALDITAGNLRNKAIGGYNSRVLGYQPSLQLQVSPVGIGLAYTF